MQEDFSPAVEPVVEEPPVALLREGVIAELDDAEAEEKSRELFAEVDDLEVLASPGGAAMVRLAMDQRRQGIAESPLGSNAGPPLQRYTRWFAPGSGPQPWCAYFVAWCLDRVGDSNRRVPWTYPGAVSSIYQWARGAGRLVAKPAHGDIFGLGSQHCGIVAGADASSVWTVEGNYEDRVRSVSRRSSGLWFARV